MSASQMKLHLHVALGLTVWQICINVLNNFLRIPVEAQCFNRKHDTKEITKFSIFLQQSNNVFFFLGNSMTTASWAERMQAYV